jgi:hypothetical protein
MFTNNSTLPFVDNKDDSLIQNLENIVFKQRKNILLTGISDVKEFLSKNFNKYINDNYITIYIDLSIDSKRTDCIEQILYHTKNMFPDNTIVCSLYEKIHIPEIIHIQKDEIFYLIFKKLVEQKHLVLVFNYFDQYANFITDNDYHRITKLYDDVCKNKVSLILIIEDKYWKLPKDSFKKRKFFETFDNTDNNSLFNSLASKNIIYKTKMNKPEIFISYAWSGKSEIIVDEICQCLENKNIKYYRDKKDIGYKDSIKEFEEQLGMGDYVILVVSDRFLKSKDCMYEVFKIINAGNIYDRIFPIVLDDVKIYHPKERIEYVKYWEDEIDTLETKLKTIKAANLDGLRMDIDNFTKYREIIDKIVTILKDMNTLNINSIRENNYSVLLEAIEKQFNKDFSSMPEILTVDNTKESKIISQYGEKSVYIENHTGNITIN